MPRKRRTTACDLCHNRKVRCDAVKAGVPCSNCSRHSLQCVVSEAHSSPQFAQRAVPSERKHKFRLKTLLGHLDERDKGNTNLSSSPGPNVDAGDGSHERVDGNDQHVAAADGDRVQIDLPAFITPLSTTIDAKALLILIQRNALVFPAQETINALLRSFFCYVYPLLPVIRLDDFLAAMQGEHGKTVSLFLFQAVLLAGAAFTNFSDLQQSDFRDSKHAQQMFYGQVKLLYDMEVDTNPVNMIQALLLMTYWHAHLNDTKGRVYWLRIALSLAVDVGLHNPDLQYEDLEEYNFRRRLWSCCVIRTQLVCVGERRQVIVLCENSNRSILSLEHFSSASLSRAFDAYSVPHNTEEIDLLGQMLVAEVELCEIIRDILGSLYELSGLRKVLCSDSIMLLIPKAKDIVAEVIGLDRRLRDWHRSASETGVFQYGRFDNDSIIPLHAAALEMIYLTALSAAHRPIMVQKRNREYATEAIRLFSADVLRSAACRITEIGRDLEIVNKICFLPPVATAIFLTAGIQHLKDAMSADRSRCRSGSTYLGQTLTIFRLLSERYNHVNSAIEFFTHVQKSQHFEHSLEWEDRIITKSHGHSHVINPRAGGSANAVGNNSRAVHSTMTSPKDNAQEGSVQSVDTPDVFWDLHFATASNFDSFTQLFFDHRD